MGSKSIEFVVFPVSDPSLKPTINDWGNTGETMIIYYVEAQQAVEKLCIDALDRHSREGGNPEVVDFKQTGVPIKHSGMTD